MRSWSTQDIDRRRSLAYWVDTVGKVLLELEIDAAVPERFRANLQQCALGPASLNLIDASDQWMQRTRASIARSRSPSIYLLQLREGQFALRQYGRDCRVRTGDYVLIDSEEPYRLSCPERTVCLSIDFPRDWLSHWIPAPELLAATRLPRNGWGVALCSALQCLEPAKVESLALPGGVVAEQVAALLALAVGVREEQSARQPKLIEQIRRTLRERYFESDLTPAGVASFHGIGRRHLHYLFANEGATFSAELMGLRLEHARQMLDDRRFARICIGEIAARCGFSDPSHFARRFKSRFHIAPAAYRKEPQSQAGGDFPTPSGNSPRSPPS